MKSEWTGAERYCEGCDDQFVGEVCNAKHPIYYYKAVENTTVGVLATRRNNQEQRAKLQSTTRNAVPGTKYCKRCRLLFTGDTCPESHAIFMYTTKDIPTTAEVRTCSPACLCS